jgi:enterochelin esterase-like enzyme
VVTQTFTPAPPASPTSLLPTRPPTIVPPTVTSTPVITPSPTVPPCTETEGRLLEDQSFDSDVAGGEVPYNMYVPPCFFSSGLRYPYVTLLHGSGFDYTQWSDDIEIHTILDEAIVAGELMPMVIVMPEGGVPLELNDYNVDLLFEDEILDELIPQLESQYCLWNEQNGRAIGGISRGGFWAFVTVFRHPDEFISLGGHSPFFPEDVPPEYNPINIAIGLPPNTPLRIYMDHGQVDSGAQETSRLYTVLGNRTINADYVVSPTGGHDNAYWRSQARNYLDFYNGGWPQSLSQYPSCF